MLRFFHLQSCNDAIQIGRQEGLFAGHIRLEKRRNLREEDSKKAVLRAQAPASVAIFGIDCDFALADTADALQQRVLDNGSCSIFLRTVPRGELSNIALKIVSDLADSSWNVLRIVRCALLGRSGSYWLAVVAERADAHGVRTVWTGDFLLAHGDLVVQACERDRQGWVAVFHVAALLRPSGGGTKKRPPWVSHGGRYTRYSVLKRAH